MEIRSTLDPKRHEPRPQEARIIQAVGIDWTQFLVPSIPSMVGSNWIVGVVGALQLEVISTRSEAEYDLPIGFESTIYDTARWVDIKDEAQRKGFIAEQRASLAEDGDNALVFLARNAWELERVQKDWPDVTFLSVRERIHGEGAVQ